MYFADEELTDTPTTPTIGTNFFKKKRKNKNRTDERQPLLRGGSVGAGDGRSRRQPGKYLIFIIFPTFMNTKTS